MKKERKRVRAATREGMRVTTIALTDEMHRQLAIEALERRTVMTELVRLALAEWLAKQAKARSKRGTGK